MNIHRIRHIIFLADTKVELTVKKNAPSKGVFGLLFGFRRHTECVFSKPLAGR